MIAEQDRLQETLARARVIREGIHALIEEAEALERQAQQRRAQAVERSYALAYLLTSTGGEK